MTKASDYSIQFSHCSIMPQTPVSVTNQKPIVQTRRAAKDSVKLTEIVNKTDINENICALIKNLDSKINARLGDLQGDLSKKFEHESNGIKSEIQSHFIAFDEKFECVESDLRKQTERVDIVESSIENSERLKRLNDVVIRGIPMYNNEQLTKLFELISKAIKFDHRVNSCLNNIFRINRSTDKASPIIAQFTSMLYKREFMRNYFKHGQLKLRDIGGDSDKRIFVSDNLTKKNSDILSKALELLKLKHLSKVQTRAGFVYVTYADHTNPIRISRLDELLGNECDEVGNITSESNHTIIDGSSSESRS